MAKLQKAERPIAVTGLEKAILQLRTFCVGLHVKYASHLPSHVSRSFVVLVLYVSFRSCEGVSVSADRRSKQVNEYSRSPKNVLILSYVQSIIDLYKEIIVFLLFRDANKGLT